MAIQGEENNQEVICLNPGTTGKYSSAYYGTIRVRQLACAELLGLLLAEDGSLYSLAYDTLDPHAVLGY